MLLYNMTGGAITIIDPATCRFDAAIRKHVVCDGEPAIIAEIPSDGMLEAKIGTVADGEFGGIPVFVERVTGCDPLPCDMLPDDDNTSVSFLVSTQYASAYREMYGIPDELFFTVADPVYSSDGKTVIGYTGIREAYPVKMDEWGYRLA